ncbi:MAG: EscU/YscU/HrcU family type III secretion system export apparatus switch protein [Acidobacteriota bacterium]|nr:EscU/YscU/HrcU family type III secretion system export apparatus switch protein [Acidobacteriota bacterium]
MSEKGTEQATPQRKRKARERGDSVRSRDLLSAMGMLAGLLMLGYATPQFLRQWGEFYAICIRSATLQELAGNTAWVTALRALLVRLALPLLSVMTASFCAALLTGIAQGGGVQLNPEALAFKPEKFNPVSNFGQLFSLRAAVRLLKSLLPAAVVAMLGYAALRRMTAPVQAIQLTRLTQTFSTAYTLALDAAWLTLAWSAVDYLMEWRSWNERLKMSKHELREEIREALGNPQVKARIRQVQIAIRKRKVKADLSRATVVITNPTHYAVALEFSFETMSAPVVLAKGRDLHAAEIREEARWLGIPMVENPPLARSLFKAVAPGQAIPFELYAAVAGILAYLFRQHVEEKMRRERERQHQREQEIRQPYFPSLRTTQIIGGGM